MKKFSISIYPKHDLELTWKIHKENFDGGNPCYTTCMRCGRQMRPRLAENALSRALDVYVCPECGMDEALRDATGEIMPLSDWYIIQHRAFASQEEPDIARLLPHCSFSQIFEGPKKRLPLSSVEHPVSLVAYSRSDFNGRQWFTTWFTDENARPEKELAQEIDSFQDALLALPEFQNLRSMTQMCRLYSERTTEPTEFNLYSETEHFHTWLRLITREQDYNLYVYYFLKD